MPVPRGWAGPAYASAFGVVATWVATRPAPLQDRELAALSTDLDHLAVHRVRALVGSAFVADESVTAWVVLAFLGLTVAGRALGDLRLLALLAACHVDGTLVSQALTDLRVRAGALPPAARSALDVGPSYVVTPPWCSGCCTARRSAGCCAGSASHCSRRTCSGA